MTAPWFLNSITERKSKGDITIENNRACRGNSAGFAVVMKWFFCCVLQMKVQYDKIDYNSGEIKFQR